MAKKDAVKEGMTDLFKKTEPEPGEKKSAKKTDDKIIARGVGLKESEWAELQKVADEQSTNLHAVTAYGVRYFLKEYKAGKVKIKQKNTVTLEI